MQEGRINHESEEDLSQRQQKIKEGKTIRENRVSSFEESYSTL